MSPLAWLLGLLLPACAGAGATGVPAPPPLDLARLERPASPNTALAAPEGAPARVDVTTPTFAVPAGRLFAAVARVAAAQPRTYPLASDPAALSASWVARSAVWNFPDVISARAMPAGPVSSTLALYSRSIYGRSDFGVNRRRLQAWLTALDVSLKNES